MRRAATLSAAEGLNLVLAARRSVEPELLAASINPSGGGAVAQAGEFKDEGYAEALADLALTGFGVLDCAFNNAGIVGQMRPTPEMESDSWHDVIAVNLTAAFLAAKTQIPATRKVEGLDRLHLVLLRLQQRRHVGRGGRCGPQGRRDRSGAIDRLRPCGRGHSRQHAAADGGRSRRSQAREIPRCWISSPVCIR